MSEKKAMNEEETFHDVMNAPIYTYRLTDGSYIVAEELTPDLLSEKEEEFIDDMVYCTMPGLIVFTESAYSIMSWNITTTTDITELQYSNIVARSEAPPDLKLNYFKFVVNCKSYEREQGDDIIDDLFEEFKETFIPIDDLDKQDSNEVTDIYKKRWDWKPGLN